MPVKCFVHLLWVSCLASITASGNLQAGSTKDIYLASENTVEWDSLQLEVSQENINKREPIAFKFRNIGKTGVRIVSADASCSCITPNFKQGDIPYGQYGEIFIAINFADTHKSYNLADVAVVLSTSKHPVILSVYYNAGNVVEVSPKFLSWSDKECETPKTIFFKAKLNYTLEYISLTNKYFQIDLDYEEGKSGWTVSVLPMLLEEKCKGGVLKAYFTNDQNQLVIIPVMLRAVR